MKKCEFDCIYKDDQGECDEMGGECIGNMCENFRSCEACSKTEDCERVWNR